MPAGILTIGRTKKIYPYNRENALNYATTWALKRNPRYYDYSKLGGDCTNFASQTLYAGGCIMNHTPTFGWYYVNANNKSPSWTGVNFLYNFLVNNKSKGPVAREVDMKDIDLGDIIQLSFSGTSSFNHSLIVTQIKFPLSLDNILISTHTNDCLNKPLSSYSWKGIRFLHILGTYG